MDSRQRLLKAWAFQEPDRVPVEFSVYGPLRQMPEAEPLLRFEAEEADNFHSVPGFDWGFFGLDSQYHEETIEERPGEFKRLRRVHQTPAGEFMAITTHFADEFDPSDYQWERRFIETRDDLVRLVKADRRPRRFDLDGYNRQCQEIGGRGLPCTGLLHPLGTLARMGNTEEVFAWLLTEPELVHEFLDRANRQVRESLYSVKTLDLAVPPVFMTYALEMLIPPWLGMTQFMELVFPYDQRVNQAVHAIGGRHRAHCHGNSGKFLDVFADMGIDGVEPLEPPPFGDNLLEKAKRQVGRRMLLSGNIPSQAFPSMSCDEVQDLVRQAVSVGAPGAVSPCGSLEEP